MKTRQQMKIQAEKFNYDMQTTAWKNKSEIAHRTVGNNYPKKIRELGQGKETSKKKTSPDA